MVAARVPGFPDFAAFSRTLRPTVGFVGLFVRGFHLAGATADPCDDFVVRGLARGDALDQAGVRVDVWWSPPQAVGVEEPRREQKRRALGSADSASVMRGSAATAARSTPSR